MVLLEAMSHELPIISTDVGGWREIVKKGNVGISLPRGNVDALTEAIISLLRDDEFRKELAASARSLVLRRSRGTSWERTWRICTLG